MSITLRMCTSAPLTNWLLEACILQWLSASLARVRFARSQQAAAAWTLSGIHTGEKSLTLQQGAHIMWQQRRTFLGPRRRVDNTEWWETFCCTSIKHPLSETAGILPTSLATYHTTLTGSIELASKSLLPLRLLDGLLRFAMIVVERHESVKARQWRSLCFSYHFGTAYLQLHIRLVSRV